MLLAFPPGRHPVGLPMASGTESCRISNTSKMMPGHVEGLDWTTLFTFDKVGRFYMKHL